MLIHWCIVLLIAFRSSSSSIGSENKRIYSTLQIIPKNENELRLLSTIYLTDDEMVDFWKPPTAINNTIDVMVYPEFRDKLNQLLQKHSIYYRVAIDDVARYLRENEKITTKKDKLLGGERRLRDDSSTNLNLQLGEYYSYDDIVRWLKSLEKQYPDIVKVTSIGVTPEGRTIYGVKLGTKHINSTRVVWIDAGIHAREWASVHTALYFIKQLITEYYTDPKITEYLRLLDIYIYPCLNPDGYEYTRSNPGDPSVRLWRKNRGSVERCIFKDGKNRCCKGVDLNRNFAFHFAEIGSSFSPCSEIYHGERAFSEQETRAVRDAVLSLSNRMEAYITLHTYSQLWVYPYSNKKFAYSPDVNDLKAVAKKAVESLGKLYGTQYRYGTGPEIIYAYAGGSADWAKATASVKYSYTIELRPSYFSWNGFILDKRQLIPTGRETYEGIKVVIDKVIAEDKQRRGIVICEDKAQPCAHWKKQNPKICENTRPFMETQCRKTCAFC